MTMKKPLPLLSCIATAAACLFVLNSAMAQALSSSDFSAAKSRIQSDYKTDKAACGSRAGNAKDICIAEAKGKEEVAKAELEHNYKPTLKTQYQVNVARGEASYELAKQKCDDMSGNPKDVCIKEAKAALTTAKADAIVQKKTAEAKAKASHENKETRTDAAADKRAAELKVAEEKCDALASSAKDSCMAAAKAKFGKL
jgi:hypothetical protein